MIKIITFVENKYDIYHTYIQVSNHNKNTMKKITVTIICLIFFHLSLFSQWTQLTSGTTNYLHSIFFPNINIGYVVGDNGLIIKTTDAGNIWTQQISGTTYSLYSVYFTDENTGYVVGGSNNHGIILKTSDGGINWIKITDTINYFLTSVYFQNASIGSIVGQDGIMMRTTNAGINWTTQNTIGTCEYLNSVFLYNNQGCAVGAFYNPLDFIYNGAIQRTYDTGSSWTLLQSGYSNGLNSVYFTDINTVYAVGDNGTILKSTNSGVSWIQLSSPIMYHFCSVFFTDANTGYIVGVGGMILKTTDAGTSWTQQSSGINKYLVSVYFTNTNTGYIVGENGIILKTQNGGDLITENSINSSFIIYPVPTNNSVTIENKNCLEGKYNLILRNVLGQEVLLKNVIFPDTYQLDLTNLENGIYFLTIISDKEEIVKKIELYK